jgi:RimJ/RimL family protein N-acetyltransferase
MIETDRLIFRKYILEDLDLLLTMTSDSEVTRYIRHGRPWTREETVESLHRFIGWNKTDLGLYIALSKTDHSLIGHAGVIPQNIDGQLEYEVGYWVVRDKWGQGYGLEQARAWKEYGLHTLNKKRLISIIQHGNRTSKHVAEKNGMSYERDIEFNGMNVALYSVNLSM